MTFPFTSVASNLFTRLQFLSQSKSKTSHAPNNSAHETASNLSNDFDSSELSCIIGQFSTDHNLELERRIERIENARTRRGLNSSKRSCRISSSNRVSSSSSSRSIGVAVGDEQRHDDDGQSVAQDYGHAGLRVAQW